jgi:hypothetical protein
MVMFVVSSVKSLGNIAKKLVSQQRRCFIRLVGINKKRNEIQRKVQT